MGADSFRITHSRGKTAKEAFAAAREEAQYEHGHGGYSGTIAEKHSFTVIPLPKDTDPMLEVERLIDEDDERIQDKWGPAGCIDLGKDPVHPALRRYLFFGWASS